MNYYKSAVCIIFMLIVVKSDCVLSDCSKNILVLLKIVFLIKKIKTFCWGNTFPFFDLEIPKKIHSKILLPFFGRNSGVDIFRSQQTKKFCLEWNCYILFETAFACASDVLLVEEQ